MPSFEEVLAKDFASVLHKGKEISVDSKSP